VIFGKEEPDMSRYKENRQKGPLPSYTPSDPEKPCLPKRGDYVGAVSWLQAVRDRIGEPFVFALDEALMCQGSFGGRNDEFVVWGYGNASAARFNGVVLLGEQIERTDIEERNGLFYTNFNRTLSDALACEEILDMQGITEALSRYYDSHGESFEGISVAAEYRERFEKLAAEAAGYYEG
jgi:hypothetical protein